MIGKLVGIVAMNIAVFAWMVLERLRISKFVHTMMERMMKREKWRGATIIVSISVVVLIVSIALIVALLDGDRTPAQWRLIENWNGTVGTPIAPEWQLTETWDGIIGAPHERRLTEAWTSVVKAPMGWLLVETWHNALEAPEWQLVEEWMGPIGASGAWGLVEMWTGGVV